MENFIDVGGYKVHLRNISQEKSINIQKDLTVEPYSLYGVNNQNNDKSYKLYTIENEMLVVPKFYGIKYISDKIIEKYDDNSANIIFTGIIRDYQTSIIAKCHEHLKIFGGGLLSIGCGRGKTVIALKLAAMLGRKTLIIVHKQFVQDQWMERIKTFTQSSVGIIRGKKVDIENKDFVVGMIESISTHDYGDIFKCFGFVIYDEAHHVAAKVYSRTLKKTGAKYSIALSATPQRNDGLIKIMHWYIGDTIHKEGTIINSSVVVKLINFTSDSVMFTEKKRWILGQMRPDLVAMTKNLCLIKTRNKLLAKIIVAISRNLDRKILVLSSLLNHLDCLKTIVDKKIQKLIEKNKIMRNDILTYYYIGEMNMLERKESEIYGDIIFATYDMAQEALDIPKLNTLVLATSKRNIVQPIGRIQRKILGCGDMRPLVVDIVDNLNVYKNQSYCRKKFYNKSCYSVENYNVHDKIITPKIKVKNLIKTTLINDEDLNGIVSEPPEKKKYTSFTLRGGQNSAKN